MQTEGYSKVACGSQAGVGVIRGALIGMAAGIYFGSDQILKTQNVDRVALSGTIKSTTHLAALFSLFLGSYSALNCSLIQKYNYPSWLSSPIAGCVSGAITAVVYTRDPRSILRVAVLSTFITCATSAVQLFK